MRIEIHPPGQRNPDPNEPEPVRLRRRVLEALYDDDLPLAYEIVAAAEADLAGVTDPDLIRALTVIRRYLDEGKAATLARLKTIGKSPAWGLPIRQCRRCLIPLGSKDTGRTCPQCRVTSEPSRSVRTVSGGLPTLGKRRR